VSGALSYSGSTHAPVSPTLTPMSPAPPSMSLPLPPLSPALPELDSIPVLPVHREMDSITAARARAMELERIAGSSGEPCAELEHNGEPQPTPDSAGREKDPDVYPNRWSKYGSP
jgi:hypothetical protein